jgi:hypothetical protein
MFPGEVELIQAVGDMYRRMVAPVGLHITGFELAIDLGAAVHGAGVCAVIPK